MKTETSRVEAVEAKAETRLADIENYILDAGSDHVPTFGGKFEGGIQVQQVPDEIAPCLLAIMDSGELVKAYLEIGAAAGGTAFLFDHFFKPETIVLIDDNRHPKAHVRPYILRDIKYTEIIGHSQAQGTVDVLRSRYAKFDVILIDGDHTYPGVSADVAIYREDLRVGGFLILHDSALDSWGIRQVVRELKDDSDFEFIAEYVSAKWNICGIAMFRKVGKNENIK
jgi:predicted O-methyltransferase YrrM